MGNKRDLEGSVSTFAIIGCGQIGSLYDEGQPEGPAKSHASAIQKMTGAQLLALCDPNEERLREAGRARQVQLLFASPETLFAQTRPDVAVIATSTSVRLEPIRLALANGVRAIVCEKPLARSFEEGLQIRSMLQASPRPFIINFSRRWDQRLRDLRAQIHSGAFGEIQRIISVYGKGLGNNGSHQIDLVNFLFGTPKRVRCLGHRSTEKVSFEKSDRSLDAELVYEFQGREFVVSLLATNYEAYSFFEADLIFERGRARLTEGGHRLEISFVEADERYPTYKVLGSATAGPTELSLALERLVEEVLDLKDQPGCKPSCTLEDGLLVLQTIESILKSEADQGAWITIDFISG